MIIVLAIQLGRERDCAAEDQNAHDIGSCAANSSKSIARDRCHHTVDIAIVRPHLRLFGLMFEALSQTKPMKRLGHKESGNVINFGNQT